MTASNFMNDGSKNRVTLFANANVRIVRGLSVNFFGNIARVRDQVFLPRRDASDEEVLLRQRDLQTSFDYQMNVTCVSRSGRFSTTSSTRASTRGRKFLRVF